MWILFVIYAVRDLPISTFPFKTETSCKEAVVILKIKPPIYDVFCIQNKD